MNSHEGKGKPCALQIDYAFIWAKQVIVGLN